MQIQRQSFTKYNYISPEWMLKSGAGNFVLLLNIFISVAFWQTETHL